MTIVVKEFNEILSMIKTEPYVILPNFTGSKKKEVIHNQQIRHKEKYSFYQKAFDFIYEHKMVGDYFEFGVHKARTFRFALSEANAKNMNMNFFALDSFNGLPNYKDNLLQNPNWKPQMLKTSISDFNSLIKKYKKNLKVNIIEGFYSQHLTNGKLKKSSILNRKFKKNKSSFICVDCDLIQSVEDALQVSLHTIQNGTILYIDDYYSSFRGHPRKGIPEVLKKFFNKNKILAEPWHLIGSCGKSFLLFPDN